MAKKLITYIQHPAGEKSTWESLNPILLQGEIGIELDSSGKAVKYKIGPGAWNNLDYIQDIYEYSDTVNNQIGDLTGSLQGRKLQDIIKDMAVVYQTPAISGVKNDASVSIASSSVLEIGTTLKSTLSISYSVSNQSNLSGSTPINASSNLGIFSNEGSFPVGTIGLTSSAYKPTSVTTLVVSLTATHQKGTTSAVSTSIAFYPKAYAGVWQTTGITGADIPNLESKHTYISNVYKREYTFDTPGYGVVAIPTMLGMTSPVFLDTTTTGVTLEYDMTLVGTLSVNTGKSTYDMTVYRTTNYMLSSSKMTIA